MAIVDPFKRPSAGIVDPFKAKAAGVPPVAAPNKAPDQPQAFTRPERSMGELAKDTGLGVVQGAVNLAGSAASIVDASLPVRAARAVAESVTNQRVPTFSEDLIPQTSKAIEAEQTPFLRGKKKELAETEGFVASAKKVLTEPALLGNFAAEQIPNLVGTGATVAKAAGSATKAALAKGATDDVVKAAGKEAGERAVVGTNAAMEAGPAAQQAYAEAMALPPEVWAQNADYVAAVNNGVDPELAKAQIARDAAQVGMGMGALFGAAGGAIAAPFESKLFTRNLPKGGAGAVAANIAVGTAREAGEEAVQEGGGQFGSNLGVSMVDPNKELMEGVPEAAGTGAAIGGVLGGGMATVGQPFQRAPKAQPAPAQEPAQPAQDPTLDIKPLDLNSPEGEAAFRESQRQGRTPTWVSEPQVVDPATGATAPMPDPANGPISAAANVAAQTGAAPTVAGTEPTIPAGANAAAVPYPDAAPGSLADAANAIPAITVPPAPSAEQQTAGALTEQAATLRGEADTALPEPLRVQRAALQQAVANAADPEAKKAAQSELDAWTERFKKEAETYDTSTAKAADIDAAVNQPSADPAARWEGMAPEKRAEFITSAGWTDSAGNLSDLGKKWAGTPFNDLPTGVQRAFTQRVTPQTQPAPAADDAAQAQSTPPAEPKAAAQTPSADATPLAEATEGSPAGADATAASEQIATESVNNSETSAEPAVNVSPGEAPVDLAARAAATSPANDRPEPTPAQKEAGNYAKGHHRIAKLDVSIENEAGTKRQPEWPPLVDHYGYIKRTQAADSAENKRQGADVFMAPRADDTTLPVFVVDQNNADGTFDEHKVVLGATSEAEAREIYQRNYSPGWDRAGGVTQMTHDEFEAWVRDPSKTTVRAKAESYVDENGNFKTVAAPEPVAAPERTIASPAAARGDKAFRNALKVIDDEMNARTGLQMPGTAINSSAGMDAYQGWLDGKAGIAPNPRVTGGQGTDYYGRMYAAARGEAAPNPSAEGESAQPTSSEEVSNEGQDQQSEVPAGQEGAAVQGSADEAQVTERRSNAEGRARVDAAPADARDAEIEKLRAEKAELQRKLDTDPLTGTRSKDAYIRDRDAAVGKFFALLDLKLFKGYNTVGGQTGGDIVLRAFGQAMLDAETDADARGYRSGGDEFSLIADSEEAARAMADRVRANAAEIRLTLEHNGVTYDVEGVPLSGIGYGPNEKAADENLTSIKGDYDRAGLPESIKRRDDPVQQGAAPAVEGGESDVGDVQGQAGVNDEDLALDAQFARQLPFVESRIAADEVQDALIATGAKRNINKAIEAIQANDDDQLKRALRSMMFGGIATHFPDLVAFVTDVYNQRFPESTAEAEATDDALPNPFPEPPATPDVAPEPKKAEPPKGKRVSKQEQRELEASLFRRLTENPDMVGRDLEAITNELHSLTADTPMPPGAVDKLSRAIFKALTAKADQLAKDKHRDPVVLNAAISAAVAASYPSAADVTPAQHTAFIAGFHHALAGKTKSTMTGDDLADRLKGYKAAQDWIETEEGEAYYEGRPTKKLENTGADLRRWYEQLQEKLKASETDATKGWKAALRATVRADLFAPYLTEGTTPSLRVYVEAMRDQVMPFREWLASEWSFGGDTAWGGRHRKKGDKTDDDYLVDGTRYPYKYQNGNYIKVPGWETDAGARAMWFQEQAGRYVAMVSELLSPLAYKATVEGAAAEFEAKFISAEKLAQQIRPSGTISTYADVMGDGFKAVKPVINSKFIGWGDRGIAKFRSGSDFTKNLISNAATLTVDKPKRSTPLVQPKLDHITRTGKTDHRKGKDVTPAEFKATFGFADVGFGKWVGVQQDQDHLNYAFDAFMDLAEHFGIEPSAVGMGGKLHLTIGALGQGQKAAAHFTLGQPHPDGGMVPVINLTNTKGDGTVYHEWAHAFDLLGAHGEWVNNVQRRVLQILKQRQATVADVEAQARRFLTGGWRYSHQGRNATVIDHARRSLEARDLERFLGATEYYRQAQALDNGNTSDPYWSNDKELFARAVEAWSADTLGGTNTYLVNPRWAGDGIVTKAAGYRGTPYPTGDERKLFNKLLTALTKATSVVDGQMTVSLAKFDEAFGADDSGEMRRQELIAPGGMEAFYDQLQAEAAAERAAAEAEKEAKAAEERRKREEEEAEAERQAAAALAALAAERAPAPSDAQGDLSDEELSAIFDQAAAELRERNADEPKAPPPGEAVADLADEARAETPLPALFKTAPEFDAWLRANGAGGQLKSQSGDDGVGGLLIDPGKEGWSQGVTSSKRIIIGADERLVFQIADGRLVWWDHATGKVAQVHPKDPRFRWHGEPGKNPLVPPAPDLAAKQDRTAKRMAAEAAKLGVQGIEDTLAGLVKLFGGGPGKLQSFPGGFDEDTYRAAKPLFQSALANFQAAGKTLKDLFGFLIQQFGEGIKEYAVRFAKDEKLGNGLAATAPTASPSMQLAAWVQEQLGNGETIEWRDLFAQGDRAFGGTQAEGKYTPKDAYDALEAGINQHIMAHPQAYNPQTSATGAITAVGELRRLLDRVPTQSKRTAEQDDYQQFSTVPPLAFMANWVANITANDVMLEPSAGIGGLAVFAKNAGAKLVLNELSTRRAAVLQDVFPSSRVFHENAEQLHNILPDEIVPSVVVMNPPFSASAATGRKSNSVGAEHIDQALKRLAEGGRLVAVMGEGMKLDASAQQKWWAGIRAKYDVRAVVPMDGKNYAKYGTTFNNVLIVIDKVAPVADRSPITTPVKEYNELAGILLEVRNERPAATVPVESNGQLERDAAESARRDPDDAGQGDPGARDVAGGAAGVGARPGAGGTGVAGKGGRGRAGGRGGKSGGSVPQPGGSGNGNPRVDDAAGSGNGAAADGRGSGSGVKIEAVEQQTAELTESVYETGSTRLHIPGAKPHPGPLVESAAMASVQPPEPTYSPDLPEEVITEGKLSIKQLESVVYAGQAHEQLLPDGTRRGFFIGDGTGVGKGREISGIILDNLRRGRKKAVWVSEKQDLMGSPSGDGEGATRDFKGIGGDHSLIFNQNKTKAGDAIKAENGIIFTTYSTLRSGADLKPPPKPNAKGKVDPRAKKARTFAMNRVYGDAVIGVTQDGARIEGVVEQRHYTWGNGPIPISLRDAAGVVHRDVTIDEIATAELEGVIKPEKKAPAKKKEASRLQQLVDWLGKDFDGVLVFDEAHNGGNSVPMAGGARGSSQPSAQGLAVVELQKLLPKARVVYVSATGATKVENLAYATRLGLWGEGTPFAAVSNFIDQMIAGGLATMELVARDMKQMGSYLARSLSFDGVSYSRLEHELTPGQTETYNRLAEAWQVTLREFDKALEVIGASKDGKAKKGSQASSIKSQYWGAQQRFFNQIITSMQMPAVIAQMEKDLAAGDALVLQLVNTNEAQMERALAAQKEEGESTELEDLDLTPRDQLLQMVEKSFPVQQHEDYVDSEGKKATRLVKDSDGNPVLNKEAVAARDKLLEDLRNITVPDGPLEAIINHFGHEIVGEVTGRKQRVVLTQNEDGDVKPVIQKRGDSAARADAEAFMADKKRILVFSDAGGTGFSFQADRTKKNQRKRKHYLIQPGWRADKAVQGFGRTHRTNQVSAPHYYLAATNIPAHKRFLSSIARRLDQLGALTKGQRDTANQGLFSEKDNLESKYATQAVHQLIEDLQAGRLSQPRIFSPGDTVTSPSTPGVDYIVVSDDGGDYVNVRKPDGTEGKAIRKKLDGGMTGITFAEFVRQMGFEGIVDKDSGKIAEAKLPATSQFLNRMLSLTLDVQNTVFDAFIARMEAKIEIAISRDELDTGMETIKAIESKVVSDDVIYTDPRTKAETRLVELDLTVANEIYPFPNARFQGMDATWVVNEASGRVWLKVRSGSHTDAKTGVTSERYRMMGTGGSAVRAGTDFAPKPGQKPAFKEITEAEAKALWEAENAVRPPTVQRKNYLIVGALLPIWDRLQTDAKIRVVRTQTTDGQRLLGRLVLPGDIAEVRKRFNVSSSAAKLSPAEVLQAILKNQVGELANGWKLKRSMVSGQLRVELVSKEERLLTLYGPAAAELTGLGVINERIDWKERYFVPVGQDGVGVLTRLFASKPLVDLIDPAAKTAGPDAGVFSKPEASTGRGKGFSIGIGEGDLRRAIEQATKGWKGDRPIVRVVQDASRLPAAAKTDPEWRRAEGWYDGGQFVYLVASNIGNIQRGLQVFAHEVVGHYGVEQIVGREGWQQILADVARLRGNPNLTAGVQGALDSTLRRYPSADPTTFAREFLAILAERGVRTGVLDRILAVVRRWLRSIGLQWNDTALVEADLLQVVAAGLRRVRDGGGDGPKGGKRQMGAAPSNASPTFFSALAESVERGAGAPKKGDAAAWRGWLDGAQRRGEFKAAEREWMGVDAWLAERETTTRRELAEFIRANRVEVTDVVFADENANAERIQQISEQLMEEFGIEAVENDMDGTLEFLNENGAPIVIEDADEDAAPLMQELMDGDARRPKFPDQIMGSGGNNYRELLLTLPPKGVQAGGRAVFKDLDGPDNLMVDLDAAGLSDTLEYGRDDGNDYAVVFDNVIPQEAIDLIRANGGTLETNDGKAPEPVFVASHFDTPNVLAHVRFNERVDENGKRVLFLEEIQSDWHQRGRKAGYGNSIPDAPFKKSWPMLAFKRMVRWAAENGFDRIAWTPGDVQNERYSLSHQVESLEWGQAQSPQARPTDKYVTLKLHTGGTAYFLFDEKGVIFVAGGARGFDASIGKPLDEVIGKPVAERILGAPKGKLSGDGLNIGGDGMRGFYDKILPAEVNAWAKPFGGKVGKGNVADPVLGADLKPTGKLSLTEVHSIDLTPAMREAALGGLPLFSKADPTDDLAFKAWFGKSVARNADGTPMVVYRGEHGDEAGELQTRLASITFTDDPAVASTYAIEPNNRNDRFAVAPRVTPAYLSIKNPIFDNRDDPFVDLSLIVQKLGQAEAARIAEENADAIENTGNWDENFSDEFEGVEDLLERAPERVGELYLDAYKVLDDDVFVRKAKAAGFDGAVHVGNGASSEALEFRVFDRGQIKSVHNRGTWDGNDPRMAYSKPDPAGTVPLSPEAHLSVWEKIRGKVTDLKPLALALIPMNYLADFAHKGMTAITAYIDTRYQMDAMRNALHAKYDAVAQEWLSFNLSHRAEAKALATLMHDSTIAEVDPTAPRTDYPERGGLRHLYDELRARYDALPPAAQELYATVRNSYSEQLDLLDEVTEGNLKRALEITEARARRDYERDRAEIETDADLTEAERSEAITKLEKRHAERLARANQGAAAKVARLKERLQEMRVKAPYFPLKRFGGYSVAVKKDGLTIAFSKFESAADAEAFRREQAAIPGQDAAMWRDIEKDGTLSGVDPQFVADVSEMIDGAGLAKGAAEALRDQLFQRFLESLPDLSMRKSFIHRKKTPGYNPDALRAFSHVMFHGSYQIARMKYGPELAEQLELAEVQAKEHSPVEGAALVTELGKRHQWVMNPKGSVGAQFATSLAFVWHLGASPAHLLLNATQTIMLGVPILGSKYGFAKTTTALSKAAADFTKGRGHIERAALTPDEKRAMEQCIESGLFEKSQAHDLAGVGESGVEYNALRHRVMSKLGWFFHQSERFNREVTALAAYRLARGEGLGHDAALNRATKLTYQIHFDYSASNRARVMQNDAAKILLVFRNYNINMLYRLFRDIHDAFKGESRQARNEAQKQLGAMFGMYTLMAGLAGAPFYGLAMALAGLFDDDDEPFDAEARFRQGTIELLGEDAARVLFSGVPGATFDVDLSERIGMPNLWFRSPDRELEGQDAYYYWMEQLLGATPAILKNQITGWKLVREGNVAKGFEAMSPAALRNVLRSVRYAVTGEERNLDGDPILKIDAGDVVARAIGFTPLELSEQYDKNSTLKQGDAKLLKRRGRLMTRYAAAARVQDAEEVRAVLGDIRAFNAANPAYAVTRETIERSMTARIRNDLMAEGGIVMHKRLQLLERERTGE